MERINLSGQRFGKLVALHQGPANEYKNTSHSTWKCLCDCGNTAFVETQKLRSGHSKSCGCNRGQTWRPGLRFGMLTTVENLGGRKWLVRCDCGNTKTAHATNIPRMSDCGCIDKPGNNTSHGMTGSPEYRAWHNAKTRCFRKKSEKYPAYGGRGITMCDRWKNNFNRFFQDMGPCPKGYQLDRIDNDGNYEPSNCRWASVKTQSLNKQNSLLFQGVPLKDIARERGINYYTLRAAFRRGENPKTFVPKSR